MRRKSGVVASSSKRSWSKEIGAIVGFIVVFSVISTLVKSSVSPGQSAIDNVNTYLESSDWKEYNSTSGNFRILFPTFPKQDSQSISATENYPAMTYVTYTSILEDGTTYVVGSVEYPNSVDVSDPKNNLDGVVNGAIVAVSGKLISSNFSTFNGVSSVDYLIKAEGAYLKYRSFLIGHSLYTLGIASETNNFPYFDKFANSFQLINSY